MNKNLHKTHSIYKSLSILSALIVVVFFLSGFNVTAERTSPFENQAKVIKCYPNPATSVVNFEFNGQADNTASLEIYSFTGKKMTNLPFSSNKITIQLNNDFFRGIYIYQVKDKNGKTIETGKFQVEK